MIVKQLSVFLENREGRIKDVLEILATNDINLVAISLADTSEYGLLRMIVSDPEKAQRVLKENYVSAMLTDVICIRVPHAVGSLYKAMKALEDAKVNVEYMYAFANGDDASAVLKTRDAELAIKTLEEKGFSVYTKDEAYATGA
ncbi:MAG: amino acid-binding protein [Lachnospiraceae bacterium]|nr:amino acid-binding protein [Lachnospiraceae bacterium]MDD7178409.1 amino acid-binding protein [bacterium]MDY5518579.1 amino acid-binding protein [Lachnospiraceae bacterium]